MVLADFIALMIASAPVHPAPVAEPGVVPQNAVVMTDQTPIANDLAKPAVFIEDGTKAAIVGSGSSGPIA